MVQPWLVFVESNTSGTGRLFAATAYRKGYRPVVLTDAPSRYPYLTQDAITTVSTATQDLAAMERAVAQLAATAPVAGIFSTSEYYIEAAASLAKAFELPGADPTSIANCRNKWTQQQRLEQTLSCVPACRRAVAAEEACQAAEAIGWPVIVKPVLGTGSIGVRLCHTSDDVYRQASLLLERTVNERGMPVPREVLVEEYLNGPEFSVETFHTQVLGITRKHLSREPYFVEAGHDFPAELPSQAAADVGTVVVRALKSLGLTWGPAHTELRLTEKGPVIIEVNPRLAGGFIPEIVRLATGIDLIEETLSAVTGAEVRLNARHHLYASIRFLFCPQNGTIAALQGRDDAATVRGVADVQIYSSVGDECRIRHDFRDRIGHVITRAESLSTALEAAQDAIDKLSVLITPSKRTTDYAETV